MVAKLKQLGIGLRNMAREKGVDRQRYSDN